MCFYHFRYNYHDQGGVWPWLYPLSEFSPKGNIFIKKVYYFSKVYFFTFNKIIYFSDYLILKFISFRSSFKVLSKYCIKFGNMTWINIFIHIHLIFTLRNEFHIRVIYRQLKHISVLVCSDQLKVFICGAIEHGMVRSQGNCRWWSLEMWHFWAWLFRCLWSCRTCGSPRLRMWCSRKREQTWQQWGMSKGAWTGFFLWS